MTTTDLISCAALVISIFSLVADYFTNKRISEYQSKINIAHDLFDDSLLCQFPEALNIFLDIPNDKKLEGLEDLLITIRKKALFYRISNNEKYCEIEEICCKLDEKLINYQNITDKSERFNEASEIVIHCSELYKLIYGNY